MFRFILIVAIFSCKLACQVLNTDNLHIKISSDSINNDSTQTEKYVNNELFIPLESFKVFTNPLFVPFSNFEIKNNFNNSDTFIPLGFSSNAEYFVYLNKTELLQSLNKKYQLSKPGTFQQILGMLQVSAAAALAGYHIYKYEIKKEKK